MNMPTATVIPPTANTLKPSPPVAGPDFAAFVAIDWADQEHVFRLQVAGRTDPETGTLEQKPEAIGPWVAQLRERFPGGRVAIALEQSRGALIHALLSYDFLVLYPIHPRTVARFREAFKSSGAKSDPLDADQILEILTKHLERLHPLNPDTEATRLLGRLVEDRRRAVELRTGHLQALTASLKEYFPQALELVSGNLTSELAAAFLEKWPTFAAFQQAKTSSLKRFYFKHHIRSSQLIERVLAARQGQALTTDPAIVESGQHLSQMYLQLIATLQPLIAQYDQRIAEVFGAHPEAPLFEHLPGAGPVMAPRLLAFFGTDRSRYASANSAQSFCGIAPVSRKSGKSRAVVMRRACPKFDRQTFHEFARLSVAKSVWARNFLTYYRARGHGYHAVIRALAFKWLRVLHSCWQNHTPYNEDRYLATLKHRGSIFATLHLEKKT